MKTRDIDVSRVKRACDEAIRVSKIDLDAADFILDQLDKYIHTGSELPSFLPSISIGGMFVWSHSPQGNDYWRDIDNQIRSQRS